MILVSCIISSVPFPKQWVVPVYNLLNSQLLNKVEIKWYWESAWVDVCCFEICLQLTGSWYGVKHFSKLTQTVARWCIYLKDKKKKKKCAFTDIHQYWSNVYSLHPQLRWINKRSALNHHQTPCFERASAGASITLNLPEHSDWKHQLLFFFQQLKMRWFLLFPEWLVDWAHGTYWYLFGRRSGLCKMSISPQSSLAIEKKKEKMNRVLWKGKSA